VYTDDAAKGAESPPPKGLNLTNLSWVAQRSSGLLVAAAVPLYFLHLYNDEIVLDGEGQELADEEAAREQAIVNAREMACAELQKGHLNLKHRIDVADESGHVLITVHFRDIVRVET
jgi:hypothetical protein